MHEMKHTPEPWGLHDAYHSDPNSIPDETEVPSDERGPGFTSWECVIASGDCVVAHAKGWDASNGGFPRPSNPEEVAANARRIIACVNACAGINPEAVPDLLAALEYAYEHIMSEAESRNYDPPVPTRLVANMQSAIAKAKQTEP